MVASVRGRGLAAAAKEVAGEFAALAALARAALAAGDGHRRIVDVGASGDLVGRALGGGRLLLCRLRGGRGFGLGRLRVRRLALALALALSAATATATVVRFLT